MRRWSAFLWVCVCLWLAPLAHAGCTLSAEFARPSVAVGQTLLLNVSMTDLPPGVPQFAFALEIESANARFLDNGQTRLLLPQAPASQGGGTLIGNVGIRADAAGTIVVKVSALHPAQFDAPNLICGESGNEVFPLKAETEALATLPADASLTIVSGNGQTVRIGLRSAALALVLRNAQGEALPGFQARFAVEPPAAADLDCALCTSDAAGRISNALTVRQVGAFRVRATMLDQPGIQALFTLTGEGPIGNGSTLNVISGAGQTVTLNQSSQDLVAQLKDISGVGIAGQAIRFSVIPTDGGELSTVSVPTDADGKARTRYTPRRLVNAAVLATVVDAPALTALFPVVVSGLVPSGSSLVPISGDNQSLATGAASALLIAELRGPGGSPIAGASINASAVPAGSASLSASALVTDAQGRVSLSATPTLPGGVVVRLVVADLPDLSLNFTLNGGIQFIGGLSTPEQALASVVDRACPRLAAIPSAQRTAAQQDLLQRCSELVSGAGFAAGDVQQALRQVLPDEGLPRVTAALAARDIQTGNIDARLDALRGGSHGLSLAGLALQGGGGALPLDILSQAADAADADLLGSRWGVYATGLIGRVDRVDRRDSPGFRNDNWGVTLGVDYRFTPNLVGGIAYGYNRSDTDIVDDRGRIESDQNSLNLYFSYAHASDFYLDALLVRGNIDFNQERRIRYSIGSLTGAGVAVDQLALADSSGDNHNYAFTFGRDFNAGPWNGGGYLRSEWARIGLDGYSERAANPNAPGAGLVMAVSDRDLRSRTLTLGARLARSSSLSWGVLIPAARIEWVHEYEDAPIGLTSRLINDPNGTLFQLQGSAIDTSYGNASLSLAMILAHGRSLFVSYERRFGQDLIDQDYLNFGARFEF